jgi:hypothetical protein
MMSMQQHQQQQQPIHKLEEYKQAGTGLLYLLNTPALFLLILLRRRFGIDAVAPKRFLFGTFFLAVFHDLGGLFGHWHNPPFFSGSLSWFYCRFILLPVASWRIVEAYKAYRRRDRRHTYSLGEPYLALLGIPIKLALFLDGGLVFGAGWLLQHYNIDIAFGAWLEWGSVGLIGMTVLAFQQDTRSTRDMMNAELNAGFVQDNLEPRPVSSGPAPSPFQAAPATDDEALTTGQKS